MAEEKAAQLRVELAAKLAEAKEKEAELAAIAKEKLSEREEFQRRKEEIRQKALNASIAAREAKALQLAVQAAAKQGKL